MAGTRLRGDFSLPAPVCMRSGAGARGRGCASASRSSREHFLQVCFFQTSSRNPVPGTQFPGARSEASASRGANVPRNAGGEREGGAGAATSRFRVLWWKRFGGNLGEGSVGCGGAEVRGRGGTAAGPRSSRRGRQREGAASRGRTPPHGWRRRVSLRTRQSEGRCGKLYFLFSAWCRLVPSVILRVAA